MVHYQNSYRFGKDQEAIVLPIINEYFKRGIKPYKDQYSKCDFYDDEYEYELKSRTCFLRTYPSTMITANKMNSNKSLILLFNFRDCLAYIEYDIDRFSKYPNTMFSRAGIAEDEKLHYYIPIEDLVIIKKYPI
jgi:hypothetical protein